MALNNTQKNILDEMQTLAKMVITLKSRARNVVEMYGNEGLATVTDADIQALASFAGVTTQELQAAKSALDIVATSIGEFVVGTPATKLIKIYDNVPLT